MAIKKTAVKNTAVKNMAKLSTEKRKNSLLAKKKSLVGSTPGSGNNETAPHFLFELLVFFIEGKPNLPNKLVNSEFQINSFGLGFGFGLGKN